jgi:hypothetical protein
VRVRVNSDSLMTKLDWTSLGKNWKNASRLQRKRRAIVISGKIVPPDDIERIPFNNTEKVSQGTMLYELPRDSGCLFRRGFVTSCSEFFDNLLIGFVNRVSEWKIDNAIYV